MSELKCKEPISLRESEIKVIEYKHPISNDFKPGFQDKKKNRIPVLETKFNDDNTKIELKSSYYIGIDWIYENDVAVCVNPKFDKDVNNTNYLKMLVDGFQYPEIHKHLNDLYRIDFERPTIQIEQENDFLTPLLIIHFLQLTKRIVQKGLKYSYYRVTENLNSKVRGKVLIAQNLKQNTVRAKNTHFVCNYQVFDVNNLENRVLKKTLRFCQNYLETFDSMSGLKDVSLLFGYVNAGFQNVSPEVDLRELKNLKPNKLFKEYTEALKIAKLILRRFGYNTNAVNEKKIKTPPFWIDMSKLFEVYVYGKLRLKYPSTNLIFQYDGKYGETDILLKNKKIIIDCKYKRTYQENKYMINDIRQLSGYARDIKVRKELSVEDNFVIPCLIIYPTIESNKENIDLSKLEDCKIKSFHKFYKIGVSLPLV